MKIYLLLLGTVLSASILFGQIIQNPSFSNVCTSTQASTFNIGDGCAGPGWNCVRGHAQLNIDENGNNFTKLPAPSSINTTFAAFDGQSNETIAYLTGLEGDGVTFGKVYDFTFSVALAPHILSEPGNGTINYFVSAINREFLAVDCSGNSTIPFGMPSSAFIPIYSGQVVEGEGWTSVTVEDVLIDPFFFNFSANDIAFVISTENVSTQNGTAIYFALDDFQVTESTCDPYPCHEDYNLSSCIENNNMGYVHVACDGEVFEWNLPAGSSAIVLDPSEGTAIVNASPGTYTLKIIGEFGCEEVRTYTIVEDCCENIIPCEAPVNLFCNYGKNNVTLNWDEVPGAINYTVDFVWDDNDCGCDNFEQVSSSTTAINSLDVNLGGFSFPCFSWSVRANCGDGNLGEPSELMCFNPKAICYLPKGRAASANRQSFINERAGSLKTVTIYPNPSQGEINVEMLIEKSTDLRITIYDLNGKVVSNYNYSQVPAGVFNKNLQQVLPAGLYIVNIETEDKRMEKRLVVTK